MGQQGTRFAPTLDIIAIRDQLRNLLGSLERFRDGGKQRLGWSIDVGVRGKQSFGRPINIFGDGGKQGLGRPIDIAAGGKHGTGFCIDVVRALQRLYERVDLLGARAGMAPGELDLAASLRGTLLRCKAESMPRHLVEQVFKDQIDAAYGDTDNAEES